MHFVVGNLIIRAALTEPVLKAYLPTLWLFLSLSGPHLGYLCSANKLFCSGMWLFKKFTAGALSSHTFLTAQPVQTSEPGPNQYTLKHRDNLHKWYSY